MSGGEIQEYNSSFFNVVVKGYIEVFGLTLIWLENKFVGVGLGLLDDSCYSWPLQMIA